MRINKILYLLAVMMYGGVYGAEADLAIVRQNLSDYVTSMGSVGVSEQALLEWGIVTNSSYMALANSVTNNLEDVLTNITNVATNPCQRLLILGVATVYGEDFYIDCYSRVVELSLQGAFSREEVKWLAVPFGNQLWNRVRCRYQESGVTSLVSRIKVKVPEWSCKCDDIISGVSYTNYLREVSGDMWR